MALIVLAIVLSIISVAVTVSTVDTKMIPKINVNRKQLSSSDKGAAQVSLNVAPSEPPAG